jgi:hypothetical protein
MLTYDALSPGQRKWVDLVEACELVDHGTKEITYQQIESIHDYLVKQRLANKNFKVSKPLWLITNNAVRRGVYAFPGSGCTLTNTNLSPQELIYQKELKRFRIVV